MNRIKNLLKDLVKALLVGMAAALAAAVLLFVSGLLFGTDGSSEKASSASERAA